MSSPQNPWLSPSRLASVLNPSSSTSGGLLPKPPDPPDPSLPPSVTDFPLLLPPPSSSTYPKSTTVTATVNPNTALQFSSEILQEPSTTSSTVPHLVSDVTMSDSVEVSSSPAEYVTTNSNTEPILITIPPKNSSPILTNKASAPSPSPSSTKPLASKPDPNLLSSNRNPIPIRSSSNPIPKRSYP
ncbi:classical arabinogalactan protein 9-like [Brassica napus]|uniref:classical arabinogalactan protein 9-like n=1 Tax=Brassica napus TaxID=3708 RepID=UPI0020797CCE|nr:classical arabinogalactan protein 9-like [Brassica napus]